MHYRSPLTARTAITLFCLSVAFTRLAGMPAEAQSVPPPTALTHPLDALTPPEIDRAVGLLKDAGLLSPAGKVASLTLAEPAKADVLAWAPGQAFSRQADALLLEHGHTVAATIDLVANRVTRSAQIDGQPSFTLGEILGAADLVKADTGWREAMAKRGYTNFDHIMCNPLAVGHVSDPALAAHRLMNVPCFDATDARNNTFARPIEGLMATADLTDHRVLRLIDLGVVPVSSDMPQHDYPSQHSDRPLLKPVEMASPAGSNVTLDSGSVRWDRWSFHLRLDRRSGPVINLVRWDDHGTSRQIAYDMRVSEMFVPYMSAIPTWSFKSYLDAGEYGLGLLALPLTPGSDCPASALFLDATLADDDGKPVTMPRAMCIFERNMGDPTWRHIDPFTTSSESRPEVDLVVRSVAVIGNYDYILDTIFTRQAEIEVRVGATGIDAVQGVKARTAGDPIENVASGTLVAPNLVAVNHDHYINYRLDLDIDGQSNTLVVDRPVSETLPPGQDRRSLWRVDSRTVTSEGPVADGMDHGAVWRVMNAEKTTALGHHPAYVLMPGHNASSLLSPDDPIQARAVFSLNPLWVTPYDPAQLYAAGPLPNQGKSGQGLPDYTAAGRTIANADVVLWYTVGFHHITRAEDWPVMPTVWHSFRLIPYDFFTRNPALDISPDFAR